MSLPVSLSGRPPAKLSASLQPWMEWLQHFDQQLAQLLGKLLLQIDPLFPLPKSQPVAGVDEFDGFNGIINRGQYHRLLASEWVLADDLPDEFMRRAVEYEHMFLAPQLKEPRNDGTCLAIFDAGVHQLGGLRVFHVAMWILLAQRALQRGAEFRWAIAQQPQEVHRDTGIDALKKLLAARTLSVVTADMQQQWLDYLADKNHQVAEQWWVGCPEQLTSLSSALCPNRVSVQRLVLTQQVDIQLATRSVFKELRLAEPQGKHFNRLLQGQFNSLPVPDFTGQPDGLAQDSQLIPQQSLYVSPCSKYVALIVRGHRAYTWRIPKQLQSKMKQLSLHSFMDEKNGNFITAAFSGKEFGGLFMTDYGMHSWLWPSLSYREPAYPLVRRQGVLHKMPAVVQRSELYEAVFVLDDARTLVQWGRDRKPGHELEQKVIAEQALALLAVDKDYLVYARLHDKKELRLIRSHLSVNGGNHEMLLQKISCYQPVDKVLLCRNISWLSKKDCAWALYIGEQNLWQVGCGAAGTEQHIQLSKKHRVIALIENREDELALLVLEPNRRNLELVFDAQHKEVLVSGRSEIVHADVQGDHLAWATADQQIHVMQISTQQMLCSMPIGV